LIHELIQRHMGGKSVAIEPKLVEALCLYEWPGNLRELNSELHALCSLYGHEPCLKYKYLPARLRLATHQSAQPTPPVTSSLPPGHDEDQDPEVLRQQLRGALKQCKGNLTRAAKLLGVPRQWFYMHLTKQELYSVRETSTAVDGSPRIGDELE